MNRKQRMQNRGTALRLTQQVCDHDWTLRVDESGDPGVVNGTYTEYWLECEICGAQRAAESEDLYGYDDYLE